MRKWVVNASPLILLAKVDHIHLLTELMDTLVIPAAVAEEVNAGPDDDPARRWLREIGSEYVRATQDEASDVVAWDLGRGETAVLSWALRHPDWIAVVDDLAARKSADET
ncbi:MAG: hypothetical protein WD423_00705 [Rhodothermales bacterium]